MDQLSALLRSALSRGPAGKSIIATILRRGDKFRFGFRQEAGSDFQDTLINALPAFLQSRGGGLAFLGDLGVRQAVHGKQQCRLLSATLAGLASGELAFPQTPWNCSQWANIKEWNGTVTLKGSGTPTYQYPRPPNCGPATFSTRHCDIVKLNV